MLLTTTRCVLVPPPAPPSTLKNKVQRNLFFLMARGISFKLSRTLLKCSCSRWHCWFHWRTWLTLAVVLIYLILLLILLPLMIYGLYAVNAEATFSAWFIAGLFTLMSIPIFLANLLQHLYNYTQPHLQAYIMRILWIVPVYSIDSWLGLKFPSTAIYWSTVRECYESYALYNFLIYLLNFMEKEYDLIEVMRPRPPVTHPIPCCCCTPWPSGMRFIRWCKVAVLQYAVLRPIFTVFALITQWAGVYDEGQLRFDRSYVYIATANGISQGLALYALAYFYKGVKDLLKPLNPLLKFTAIKSIIFFTFWQAVIIAILVKANVIKESEALKKYGFEDIAVSMQDFIICVEMLVAAVAFYFIFSHKPYIDPAAAKIPCIDSVIRMMDVRDIYGDVRENFVDPIPVPRLPRSLPGRWYREKVVEENNESEDLPLLNGGEKESSVDSERGRGGEGGRRGIEENSFIILSMSQYGPTTKVQEHHSNNNNNKSHHLSSSSPNNSDDSDEIITSSSATTPPHESLDSNGSGTVRERRQVSDSDHLS